MTSGPAPEPPDVAAVLLKAASRRTLTDRMTTAWLLVSSLAIAVLVVVVFVLVGKIDATATAIHADQVSQCQASNKTRVKTHEILNAIISLPGDVAPAAKIPARVVIRDQAIAALEQKMAVNYAPTNCTAAYAVK